MDKRILLLCYMVLIVFSYAAKAEGSEDETMQVFRTCLDDIKNKVKALLQKLLEQSL